MGRDFQAVSPSRDRRQRREALTGLDDPPIYRRLAQTAAWKLCARQIGALITARRHTVRTVRAYPILPV